MYTKRFSSHNLYISMSSCWFHSVAAAAAADDGDENDDDDVAGWLAVGAPVLS